MALKLDYLTRDHDERQRQAATHAMATLTGRERDVVKAVGLGKSNAEIAGDLYLGEATVKTHLSAAQAKLGARNRVEVAVLAERGPAALKAQHSINSRSAPA